MKDNSALTSSSTQYSPDTTSISRPQSSCLEPLDVLIGFSNYDSQFIPGTSNPTSLETLSLLQPKPGSASHDYDLYRQQIGTPPGAISNTLAMNQLQECALTCQRDGGNDDFLDLQTVPNCDSGGGGGIHNSSEMEMEFDSSSTEPAYFHPALANIAMTDLDTISDHQQLYLPPTQSGDISYLWPNMDQQAFTEIQQKHESTTPQSSSRPVPKGQLHKYNNSITKVNSPIKTLIPAKDPIVEEKITQLLKSIRQSNPEFDSGGDHAMSSLSARSLTKKEEEMDEDERLLASEEGKKLSSKERRQLRNKVSARAFRSRRKEYINQLEDEIAVRINENVDLRAQNQALIEENIRLTDFTRMLASSPSFPGIIDAVTMNPNTTSNVRAYQPHLQKTDRVQLQPNKDVNHIVAQQQKQNQYLGMTVLPESPVNFTMLDLNCEESETCQPRIYFAQNLPETLIDYATISCKKRPLSSLFNENTRVNIHQINCLPTPQEYYETEDPLISDENFKEKPTVLRLNDTPLFKAYKTYAVRFNLPIFCQLHIEKLLNSSHKFVFEN
ncbi:BZIP-type transcription factor MBZ1 [Erysiphe neolycopersici]|uniref:BZIP-type transcription factor MBZ1 n=1 Tax=Erysiphe neolycopersici TaxID=212602 RepID=A0A420HBK1_9PEZI|nr:BZIP-type transcription factor MBZ1 [Erysiphe neolycopersici]